MSRCSCPGFWNSVAYCLPPDRGSEDTNPPYYSGDLLPVQAKLCSVLAKKSLLHLQLVPSPVPPRLKNPSKFW